MTFTGIVAPVDVRIDVEPHEIVGLIGPNGAGKTRFLTACPACSCRTAAAVPSATLGQIGT
jgi:ABC-type branched-subunit amino acid transport system ATPase component